MDTIKVNRKGFYKASKALVQAKYFIDEDGEQHKLTQNIKAVYIHKLDEYTFFNTQGKPYYESHQQVADKLGICLKVVNEVAIPLLKKMGLVELECKGNIVGFGRNYHTTVHTLEMLKGVLVNPKLKAPEKKEKKGKLTYEEFKQIGVNKLLIDKIRKNNTKEYVLMSVEEFRELIGK